MNIQIRLEKPSYLISEQITGLLIINTQNSITISNFELTIDKKTVIKCVDKRSNIELIHDKTNSVISKIWKNEKIVLKAGQNIFTFSFTVSSTHGPSLFQLKHINNEMWEFQNLYMINFKTLDSDKTIYQCEKKFFLTKLSAFVSKQFVIRTFNVFGYCVSERRCDLEIDKRIYTSGSKIKYRITYPCLQKVFKDLKSKMILSFKYNENVYMDTVLIKDDDNVYTFVDHNTVEGEILIPPQLQCCSEENFSINLTLVLMMSLKNNKLVSLPIDFNSFPQYLTIPEVSETLLPEKFFYDTINFNNEYY